MERLKELKNRLVEFKFWEVKNTSKEESTKTRTLITKKSSEDEDMFLFI